MDQLSIYADIAKVADQRQRGVLAVGNFALTVVLLQKFAEIAAKHIPQWEIIDYASAGKKDAPRGTGCVSGLPFVVGL